ncbi:peptidylprolyl isomerase [Psychroserpens sp. S379A]|uniref:peptidylprolyl isomerase n=1 Tax=Psychroserpens sp. S379A TaxID=3415137 RepID=UPI003C7D439D
MKMYIKPILVIVLCLLLFSYGSKNFTVNSNDKIKVEMTTNYGTMLIELHNETPLHRDNFLKLVEERAYDSLLFHRVIENFMIQGGDPDSKYAKSGAFLGEGDLDYSVEAEFRQNLFHKKGALATAREETLGRVSSAMQFFIVQGKVFNDSTLNVAEDRINNMIARHHIINRDTTLFRAFHKAYENNKDKLAEKLNDSIQNLAASFSDFNRYVIPESHREVYKTIGGTPHLDQNYTVFGEVIKGLNIIDSIAKVKTDKWDRPVKNVVIKSIRILK